MTPLDFYLWDHIKSFIYDTPMESKIDLVAAVAAGRIAQSPRVFERVRQSILKRYQTCIDVGGGHSEQLLLIYFKNKILV